MITRKLSLGVVGGASGIEQGGEELEGRQGSQNGLEGPGEVMDSSLLLLKCPTSLPQGLPQAGWHPDSMVLIFSFYWGSYELPQSGCSLHGSHMSESPS